ncbi:discoidin domain-containing protein [Aliifodinibius sp. S!AR15-10]|uniref:glycosyl hydrolase n=1 Tax=Aliifodinibius sp. S!AR15-10 TaxID=2950437 RepID=UPI0028652782|nr:glycosyl hydrolase [Aliifodinibius sp. S!AR15-10]MDR8390910.1 discoidin domain-containing protein [Aliifodinibius sp. S!AR15-10]
MKTTNTLFQSLPISVLLALGLLFLSASCSDAQSDRDEEVNLEAGFKNPHDEARPRVWWHWMNGNITKEGIRADLEWMRRVGIAGFQNFDAAFMTPPVVENRLQYMTPDWKDAFQFTTNLADSLDMEMAIAGSPGWSGSGGPWVRPAEGMKKYVWCKTRIEGGKPFNSKLPEPPSSTGPFKNLPYDGGIAAITGHQYTPPEFYKDAAVIAFRLPEGDKTLSELEHRVISSSGYVELSSLTDGDLTSGVSLPEPSEGKNEWIQFEFAQPQTFRSLTISGGGSEAMPFRPLPPSNRTLQVSEDRANFRTVAEIPNSRVDHVTLTLDEPISGKYIRVTFGSSPTPPSLAAMLGNESSEQTTEDEPSEIEIAELELHTTARVHRFEDKAGFTTIEGLYEMGTPPVNDGAISQSSVIDLTSNLNEDGTLEWTPPPGSWMVLRLGYSLTGITNHPASTEATGLEVDKLNAEHVRSYFNTYLDMYKDATGGMMGTQGLKYIITDSYEAGPQNWTDGIMEKFRELRGYSMFPWLPVLVGHVVESPEASDRFLWDFRKTIGELIVDNHYNALSDILEERNMGRYTESHESQRAFLADGMEVKRNADIPMSAMWTPSPMMGNEEIGTEYKADIRESASVAHIYGQNLVAAESMTAFGNPWSWSPQTLKPTADMELAHGVNRFVIHTSVHQPLDDKFPGFTLGPFGQWFTRHETWAEQAGPWIDYLARSSYMLQQGEYIADVAYYYGEGVNTNITTQFREQLPAVPEGYQYDFVNADALVNDLSVNKGVITTPGGTTYRILALDKNSRHMTLPVLRRIRDLVQAGAIVVGSKPVEAPSLSDDEEEFQSLVDNLWTNENGVNEVGEGRIYAGRSIREVLAALDVNPDFEYSKPEYDTELLYVHRRMNNTDIYWINNRNDRMEDVEATFRVEGKEAELWDPVTGEIEEVSYSFSDGVTNVPVRLEPNGALFVVFRDKAERPSRSIPKPTEQTLDSVEGPWEVSFQENRGASSSTTFESLTPWNEHSDEGIKYFSGTGVYTKSIEASSEWFTDERQIFLDLGEVKNLAEVVVNGDSQGIVWKKPFRVNITDGLSQGANTIEIKVTNLWVNRLIGDQQPDVSETYTWTSFPGPAPYPADAPLEPSGLLGPVQIVGM